jgi:hypothetical protein
VIDAQLAESLTVIKKLQHQSCGVIQDKRIRLHSWQCDMDKDSRSENGQILCMYLCVHTWYSDSPDNLA